MTEGAQLGCEDPLSCYLDRIKTKHSGKIDRNMIVSPSIALPATRPSIRSPAAGSQKGRWETISGVSKYRWQIISGVCNGRCRKKSIRNGKLRSNHGLRLLWQCRTCDGIQGLPKLLHGMQHARTPSQHERVSEPRLYQVPGHRTYGASVHFLRYVPNESREEQQVSESAMRILGGIRSLCEAMS